MKADALGGRGRILHVICLSRKPYRRFPTCWIADFQTGRPSKCRIRQLVAQPAGLETCETADWEICGTEKRLVPVGEFENSKIVCDAGRVCAFGRGDMSPRPKAATCRRTP